MAARKKCSPQQEEYCRQYILDFKQEQAAIRAGYSPASARFSACELMKKPHVRDMIAALLKARRQEYSVTTDRLREEVARVAFANPFDAIKDLDKGVLHIKSLREIPNKLKPAVKSIKQTKYGIEITFHDKIGAMDMLSKHLGFYEKDNDQKKVTGVAIYLPDNGRDKKNDEEPQEES